MPILIYHDNKGQYQEKSFLDTIRIGSDQGNDLILAKESGVAPRHAIIMRTAVNRLHILVDLVGQNTRVNGRPVVSIQVLHQRDEIQLGSLSLKLWELRLKYLTADDHRTLNRPCMICTKKFSLGDEVFLCPRCLTVCHRDCWFATRNCPNYTCEYPVQSRIIDALSAKVSFERYEAKEKDVIEVRADQTIIVRRDSIRCRANNRRDVVPFQPGEHIAYCPSVSCHSPFHVECWLGLKTCPHCEYDVQQLLNQVFSSVGSEPDNHQTGETYAER